jgi:hypothetical protein
MSTLTLRICGPDDEPALRRLAERDCARPLEGDVLLAEVCGEPLAAICLDTRRVVADPFVPTARLVELLRARAEQIAQPSRPPLTPGSRLRRRARAWLPRPAREPAP